MKKRVISFLLAIVMIFSALILTVSAANMGDATEALSESSGQARAEEVKWYYRTYNGVLQMRLWSVTYGYWLTDWINC